MSFFKYDMQRPRANANANKNTIQMQKSMHIHRRNHSILIPFIRRELFSKSFYPKTIREWNNLSLETKESESLHIFKEKLKRLYGHNISKKLYAHGHGLPAVNHCRMRLGLSHLKNHLFNYNIIQSKFCENSNSNSNSKYHPKTLRTEMG